jgi:hypothetical protein
VGRIAWLGATLPSAQVATLLVDLTGLQVSAATLRRHTVDLEVAAAQVADEEVARLERELPPCGAAPERLVLGVDGAMVPVGGGELGRDETGEREVATERASRARRTSPDAGHGPLLLCPPG